jgi:hypothetical protein
MSTLPLLEHMDWEPPLAETITSAHGAPLRRRHRTPQGGRGDFHVRGWS